MAQLPQEKAVNQKALVAEALGALVNSLPEDLPPEFIEVLGEVFPGGQGLLPPMLFYELVEQMSIAISIADVDANILYINPAFERLTGYSAEDILGENESRLSAKQTPKSIYENLWGTITAGGTWTGKLINRRKDGSRYLADLSIVPILNKSGKISYFLGMHRDVTEMHLLQRQVENQKSLIESVIESAPISLALLDSDGGVILGNKTYEQLGSNLAGEEPATFFLSRIAEARGVTKDKLLANALKEGFFNIEVPIERGGKGTRWFSCTGRPVHELPLAADSYFDSQTQSALLMVCNEITEQKRHFEKARISSVAAQMDEQSIRLNVREVLEGAVFQLQGPLNVISAVADMMARQPDSNPALHNALSEALRSGKEAVDRLRTATPRNRWTPVSAVNVNEIIRDVLVINIDRMLAAGIVVEWRPQPRLPGVAGEASAIGLLLKNLLDNAADAVAEPGASARDVRILTKSTPDRMVEITVMDRGPGIPRELRHKIFEPFFSGWKKAGAHAGMGLAIAQQIASEHGGSLEIDDSMTSGCAMRLLLPASVGR